MLLFFFFFSLNYRILIRVNFVLLELQIKQDQRTASGEKAKLFHKKRDPNFVSLQLSAKSCTFFLYLISLVLWNCYTE